MKQYLYLYSLEIALEAVVILAFDVSNRHDMQIFKISQKSWTQTNDFKAVGSDLETLTIVEDVTTTKISFDTH